jgi:hypothetical protein
MLIHGRERSSQLATCVADAPAILMAEEDAIAIVNHQVRVVKTNRKRYAMKQTSARWIGLCCGEGSS